MHPKIADRLYAELKSLASLSLRNNHISAYPPALCTLPGLLNLDLDGNHLSNLPPELTNVTSLQSLSICNNALVALPVGLNSLDALASLSTRGNPVSDSVREPNGNSPADVLRLLQELYARSWDATESDTAGALLRHSLLLWSLVLEIFRDFSYLPVAVCYFFQRKARRAPKLAEQLVDATAFLSVAGINCRGA
jgi:Leucine-rich repeat (LRR) protein